MNYIRYEDRKKVSKLEGNIDCSQEYRLFWRIPFPDEDNILPGDYEDDWREYPLKGFSPDIFNDKPGYMKVHHETGLWLSIKCYHGSKLPEGSLDIKPQWNVHGEKWFISLHNIVNTKDGIKVEIRCHACGKYWTCNISDIIEYVRDAALKKRLENYLKGE